MSAKMKNFLVACLFFALIGLNVYVFVSPYLPKRSGLVLYFLPNIYREESLNRFVSSLQSDLHTKIDVQYSDITDAEKYQNLVLELIQNPSSAPDIVMVYDKDDLIMSSNERLKKLLPYLEPIGGAYTVKRPNPGIPVGFALTVWCEDKDKALKIIDKLVDNYFSLR